MPRTLKNLRTSLIFSLGFTGLFRANEPLALKASDIKIETDHQEVLVQIKDRLVSPKKHSIHAFLFSCRYRATIGSLHLPATSCSDSKRSEEKKSAYQILQLSRDYQKSTGHVGENPKRFGKHNLRSGGATAIAERTSNTPNQDWLLRLQGRWKTDTSGDAYIEGSLLN